MYWLLLLLTPTAFAQVDVTAIQKLDEELPNYSDFQQTDEEIKFQRQRRRFLPPKRIISLEQIQKSEVGQGAIKTGSPIRRLDDNSSHKVFKDIYVRYYKLEDEDSYRYLLNKDGSVSWRIRSKYVEPIEEDLVLYEPPQRYTPAPKNIVRTVYDRKLSILPELSFYTGLVQGDYMADLFEDKKARSGLSNQYGLHFFTKWKIPVKAGAVLHYEKASYRLRGGGQVLYSAFSLGPQIKTRDFEIWGQPLRFQMHFRISPFARAEAETIYGSGTFKFNSTDALLSIERPFKNFLGEFVLGLYTQSQWLNLREQRVLVNLKTATETNKSLGIVFAQVFE